MKKFVFWCLLLGGIQFVHAQSVESKITYGISAGVAQSNYLLDNIRSGVGREVSPTYNGQLSGWVMFSPNAYLGLETGLSFVGLGAKLNHSEFGSQKVLQHTYWFQLPISVVGKLPLRDSSNFFLKVGAYAGYGLLGKNYTPDTYTGSAQRSFTFGNEGSQRQMDYGAQFSLGYRLSSGYRLEVGCQMGKANLAPEHAGYEQRNRSYFLAVGYQF